MQSVLRSVVGICLLLETSGWVSGQVTSNPAEHGHENQPLLLRDFKPQSMLHAPVHQVDRARFPVIDVHQRVNDARQRNENMPPARVLEIMDQFRWLETADEYFDYWGSPGQGRWKIYGLDLPDSVLEKVYHLNAERVFRQFKGVGAARYPFDMRSLTGTPHPQGSAPYGF